MTRTGIFQGLSGTGENLMAYLVRSIPLGNIGLFALQPVFRNFSARISSKQLNGKSDIRQSESHVQFP
jgi:hypothetical protein